MKKLKEEQAGAMASSVVCSALIPAACGRCFTAREELPVNF